MLTRKEAQKIGINACIDKIGREFYEKNINFSSIAYGEVENGEFCFVGVDNAKTHSKYQDSLILSSRDPMPYRVSCKVLLKNGDIEFIEVETP
ncbi:MAG: hypothetical protein J6C99_10055 [Lachnospiraceae bacterium]|nr:hypothetical protein [Lachnospiraceae bacterium]